MDKMVCPHCGREQLTAPECIYCGLVLSKWTKRAASPALRALGPRDFFRLARPLILIALGLLAWVWARRGPSLTAVVTAASCGRTISYRIGGIDPKFHIDKKAFKEPLQQAMALWESAAGRKLFEERVDGILSVNLVYDERQVNFEEREQAAWKASADKAMYEDLKKRYDAAKALYAEHMGVYESDIQKLLQQQKNLPREVYDKLEREKKELPEAVDRINALANQLNALAYVAKTTAETADSNNERMWAAGECEQDVAGTNIKINIYQYKNDQDLALKLAHELGHALRLKHVANKKSIMYYLVQDQDLDPLELTEEDKAAFAERCSLGLKNSP